MESVTADQLVSNPQSFGQFVENAFTLSFLVNNGKAGLEVPSSAAAAKGCPTVVGTSKFHSRTIMLSSFMDKSHLSVFRRNRRVWRS
jgi:hypothetical protein